jgi:hypothetical protein
MALPTVNVRQTIQQILVQNFNACKNGACLLCGQVQRSIILKSPLGILSSVPRFLLIDVEVQWVGLLHSILEVSGSYLGSETGYPGRFLCFYSVTWGECCGSTSKYAMNVFFRLIFNSFFIYISIFSSYRPEYIYHLSCWQFLFGGGGGCFTTPSVARLHSRMVGWLMNWKGLGRKRSWLNRDTISAFVWRDTTTRETTKRLTPDSQCSGRDSKRTPPEYETRTSPLR